MSPSDREARLEPYRQASRHADELAGSGKKDEALRILRENLATAEAHGDEDYRAFFEAEILNYSSTDYPRQIERLEEGLRWAADRGLPADFFLFRSLGVYHGLNGDQDAAIKWYDKALAENATDGDAIRSKGAALLNKGNEDAAIEWFDKALDENPDDWDAMRSKGAALSKQGDMDAAIEWFRKALAEKQEDSWSYRGWAVVELRKGNQERAFELICQAVELDRERWRSDFRALAKICGKDPDKEWQELFPELVPEVPKREDVPEELSFFIGRIREAFREEADDYFEKMKQYDQARQKFLEPKSQLDPARSVLMVLRRWNSYTPALPAEEDDRGRGGGYFLWHNGHGTVIDPGYDFIDNLHQAGCRLCDIDNVILTHAHNDHTIDFESLRTLLYKFNGERKKEREEAEKEREEAEKKRKAAKQQADEPKQQGGEEPKQRYEPKQVRFFLNNGAFKKLAGLIDLKDSDFTERIVTLNSGGQCELLGGGSFRVLPAYHDEIVARDQAVGLMFTLERKDDNQDWQRKILMTSDTGLFPLKRDERELVPDTRDKQAEVWHRYLEARGEQPDVMVLHIGSIKEDELKFDGPKDPARACYPNHLGVIGTARVITMCWPKLAVISEFGEEMKHIRTKLVSELQTKVLNVVRRNENPAYIPRAIPGDLAFVYDLGEEKFCDCISTDWKDIDAIDFAEGGTEDPDGVYYFQQEDRDEYLQDPAEKVKFFNAKRKRRRGMYFLPSAD